MYRPKDWKRCLKVGDNKKRYTSTEINQMYEAGADAMLEGLRRDNTWVWGAKENTMPHTLLVQGGWLVFIPDEEG